MNPPVCGRGRDTGPEDFVQSLALIVFSLHETDVDLLEGRAHLEPGGPPDRRDDGAESALCGILRPAHPDLGDTVRGSSDPIPRMA